MASQTVEFPSARLGHLLGYKGLTIQKVKEVSGVARLHIPPHEKERAKSQPSIPIEVQGTPEQVDHAKYLLDAIVQGNQSDLGHATRYVSVEPGVIGKIMGFKGKTVRELTEATGAYIEIQQDRARGMSDSPQLFLAGPPEVVDYAVQLVQRFIASPGANLQAVLAEGSGYGNTTVAGVPPLSQPTAVAAVFDPEGPKEERIVEIPARRKGHLLGLRGQTIELIRQTSGVIKCHIQADRDRGPPVKQGMVPVQIFGAPERVEQCASLVERVAAGDHTGIGHAQEYILVEPDKVERLKGDRWQVINALKDLTSTYMDILYGAEDGLPLGETQLFVVGPPEHMERAKTIVTSLLKLMDKIPADGVISSETLGGLINELVPGSSTSPPPAAAPSAPSRPLPLPPPPPPAGYNAGHQGASGSWSSVSTASQEPIGRTVRPREHPQTEAPRQNLDIVATLHDAISTLSRVAKDQEFAQLSNGTVHELPSLVGKVISQLQAVVDTSRRGLRNGSSLPALEAPRRPQRRSRSPRRFIAAGAPHTSVDSYGGWAGGGCGSSYDGYDAGSLSSYGATSQQYLHGPSDWDDGTWDYANDAATVGWNDVGIGAWSDANASSASGWASGALHVVDYPANRLGQLLGFKGLTIQKVKEIAGVSRLHIPPHEKERAKMLATIPIEIQGTQEQVDYCRTLLDAVAHGDQSDLGHATQYVSVEPSVIGKLMGHKGKTVKEMTEATSAYIEIQQDRTKGMGDSPKLFVAGPKEAVDYAVRLVHRFIQSPGADLKAVLSDSSVGNSLGGGGSLPVAAIDPEGPKEETIVEVPGRRKGHLLGLHGQTIELIRQTSGVIKCHIMVERTGGHSDKSGVVPVQVFGVPEKVRHCVELIENVVAGDHSGIGHSTEELPIPAEKVERLKGERWQVINALKDLTHCYMDIMQGVEAGLAVSETRLFVAGPPECLTRARSIVTGLLSLMDHIPADQEVSPEALSNLIGTVVPSSGGAGSDATPGALTGVAPVPGSTAGASNGAKQR